MQSLDARAELTRLRRRAYGPDADIAADPDAVARLAELESAVKAGEDGSESIPAAPPAGSADAVAQYAPVEPAAAVRPLASATRRLARRLAIAAVAVVSLVVGAAAAVGVSALSVPRPDATLQLADVDPDADPTLGDGWLASFRIARSDLRAFDEYRGYRAWSGTAPDGFVCLFVTHSDGGLVSQSCTAPGIHPVADFPPGNGLTSLGGGPRSIVRFELRGAEVHVFDRRASVSMDPS
jgi:hypothetical protein